MALTAAKAAAAFLFVAAVESDSAIAQDSGSFKFEVASVKPARQGGPGDDDIPSFMRGGPGTDDPGQITFQRQNLLRLITVAYGFDYDQISGPTWIGKELYTVVAKVPPGTTKEQVKLMWQNLLIERFQLKAHMVKGDFSVYQLSVAKGGPKLRKSGEGPAKEEPGFPVLAAGQKWGMSVAARNTRMTFRNYSMTEFAQQLRWPLSTHFEAWGALALGRVVDKTGLDGQYDFTFEFAGRRGPGGAFPPPLPEGEVETAPGMFDALRQQLGLVLEEKKAPLDVLVVDHVDRVPTEN
jgi:uncharacterized protein (TIGR03435 family)